MWKRLPNVSLIDPALMEHLHKVLVPTGGDIGGCPDSARTKSDILWLGARSIEYDDHAAEAAGCAFRHAVIVFYSKELFIQFGALLPG
jgi:hypothetical protein